MKTAIVRIGNSRGIRIPKPILEQCRLRDEVEMEVRDNCLLIRGVAEARSGWDEGFRRMRELGDDALVDEGTSATTRWDVTEWEW